MRFSLVTLLCFITWMSSVHATLGPVGNCPCPVWSKTRPPIERIADYTVQAEGVCRIRAVVFWMKTGKRVCSNPNIDWVKTAMLKVDQDKKALPKMEENKQVSTSCITPAASTTSKNTPGKVDQDTKASLVREENEQESTSDITPAASTASKNTPEKVDQDTKASLVREENEQESTSDITPLASTTSKNTPEKVDQDTKASLVREENEQESTSGITPAASTTSKKAPVKRRRKAKKRQRKTTWRRMKGQRKRT